jgi:legumain
MKLFTILVLALAVSQINAANWAVVVAGSNGYWNYRHQSDSCHAVQILKKAGFLASNIIHFAYNDIASSAQNPFPGKIYNKTNGVDVYAGCQIDYQGNDVDPVKFLAVIKGQTGPGVTKVLNSTSNDKVFLNFTDHGAPGLIAFPNAYLYATDLIAALGYMAQNNKYSKLIFYIEACESGSMFASLPANWNIYATTASNATESSWATYCGSDAVVAGVNIGSCLGDLYSVVWMEDNDLNTAGETFDSQFQIILTKTTQSNPQKFGTMSIGSDLLLGWTNDSAAPVEKTVEASKRNVINSRDIKLHYLIERHANQMSENSMNELNEEIMMRKLFDNIFSEIQTLHADVPLATDTDFVCYKDLINFFEAQCGRFTEYGLKYMRSFYDICQNKQSAVIEAKTLVMKSCSAGQLF